MKMRHRLLMAVDLGPRTDDVLTSASAPAATFGSHVLAARNPCGASRVGPADGMPSPAGSDRRSVVFVVPRRGKGAV
jgi:hypothetical protein